MNKRIIVLGLMIVLFSFSVSAGSLLTKIGLELDAFSGISFLDNTDGNSVNVTIQNSSGVVVSRGTPAIEYYPGMMITMLGNKFDLDYSTDYTYNLSTVYGDFLYNFTTSEEPSVGGVSQASFVTGQETSYRSGDDADVTGYSKIFRDRGDGTVEDLDSNLMWEKNDAGTMNWEAALSYCNGKTTAGYSDWRLPTRLELFTMADYSCSSSSDSGCYSNFQNDAFSWSTTTSYYWSSTTRPDSTGYAYLLNMNYGNMYSLDKANSDYVRCVRDI